jgi:hypothetical protein
MALEAWNLPTLWERVVALSEEELVEFARARAIQEADSSAFEGIPLDVESLNQRFLALYRRWRQEAANSR